MKLNGDKNFEHYVQKARVRQVKKLIIEHDPRSILEIGPGLNPILLRDEDLLKYSDLINYVLLEPDHFFYNCIKKEVKEKIKDSEIYRECLNFADHEIKDRKFDLIIVSSVLHEVKNDVRFLNALKKYCKKNTIIHVNVPNAKSFHKMLGKKMGIIDSLYEMSESAKTLKRKREYDYADMFFLLMDNGFDLLESGTYLIKPFSNEMMGKLITDTMFEGLMKMGEERQFKKHGCELYFNFRTIWW